MCVKCIARAKTGITSLRDACTDKVGLPYNAMCPYCEMPVFVFKRDNGTESVRNRFGQMHVETCPAVFSRADEHKVMSHPRSPRVHGYRPEDEQ